MDDRPGFIPEAGEGKEMIWIEQEGFFSWSSAKRNERTDLWNLKI